MRSTLLRRGFVFCFEFFSKFAGGEWSWARQARGRLAEYAAYTLSMFFEFQEKTLI
jgi:hypothetical protein